MRTVSDGRFHAYGSWQCETTEVRCGPAYRLGVEYRTENVDHDSVSVSMIATWIDARGDWLHRTYIDEISDSENGWRELSRIPEVARLMRLQGAEILCIPTAGEATIQTAARAVDNGVYVVVAGTNGEKPSRIINPAGEVMLAFGEEEETGVRCVTVDLNRKFYKYWESVGPAYGETQSLHIKERRPDTYGSARSCREG